MSNGNSSTADQLARVHQLDTRTTVLETKQEFMREAVLENKARLAGIDDKLGVVSIQVQEQGIILPKIEAHLAVTAERQLATETKQVSLSAKQKIIWAGLSAFVTIIITVLIKVLGG